MDRVSANVSELNSVFCYVSRVNTSTIELAVEQVMFSDKNRPVERDYEDKLLRIYEADIVPIDFHKTVEAYYEINDYVEAKTHGKISKIVQPEDLHDLQMVLISAIFFKGEWKVFIIHNTLPILLLTRPIRCSFLSIDVIPKKKRFLMRMETI